MTSSDQARPSVLADSSFLSDPSNAVSLFIAGKRSNAQMLQAQQLDAAAVSETKRYALIVAVIVAAAFLVKRLK